MEVPCIEMHGCRDHHTGDLVAALREAPYAGNVTVTAINGDTRTIESRYEDPHVRVFASQKWLDKNKEDLVRRLSPLFDLSIVVAEYIKTTSKKKKMAWR